MTETKEITSPRELLSSQYLFKNPIDALFYLVVYFGLPLRSIIEGINADDGRIYFTAFSCCVCVLYDCYSRYDRTGCRSRTVKIYVIGIAHAILAIYAYNDIQNFLEVGQRGCSLWYGLLAVAPIVGLFELYRIARDDIKARRK